MSEIRPFTVNVSDDVLARIMSRVEAFRWFPAPEAGDRSEEHTSELQSLAYL